MESKFTTEQRKEIYTTLLNEVDIPVKTNEFGSTDVYICWKLWIALGYDIKHFSLNKSEGLQDYCYQVIFESFPEFKTAFSLVFDRWYFERNQRIKLLKNCITLTNYKQP